MEEQDICYKSDLIEGVYKHPEVTVSKAAVEKIVNLFLEGIANRLTEGDNIVIRGLGTFKAKQRGERVGRNPRTGEEVMIQPRKAVTFKAGSIILNRVNKR